MELLAIALAFYFFGFWGGIAFVVILTYLSVVAS